jgi:hypothetical protein
VDLPLDELGKILSVLKFVQGVKIEQGKLTTPDGTEYVGFKITIDDGLPPVKLFYVREKVTQILHKLPSDYKVTKHSNTNISIST